MSWPGGLPPGWGNPNTMMGMQGQGQAPNQQGYPGYGQQQGYQHGQQQSQQSGWGAHGQQAPGQPGNPYGGYGQTGQPQQNGQFAAMGGYPSNQYAQMAQNPTNQAQMAQPGWNHAAMNPMMAGYQTHHHQYGAAVPSSAPTKSQHQSVMSGHQSIGHTNYPHQSAFPPRNGPAMTPVSQPPGAPGVNSSLTELLQNPTSAAPSSIAPQRPRAPSQTNVTSVYGQSMATPAQHPPRHPAVPSSQAISQSNMNGSIMYSSQNTPKMFNNPLSEQNLSPMPNFSFNQQPKVIFFTFLVGFFGMRHNA